MFDTYTKTTDTKIVTELDNKLIENMFLACASEDQIDTFYRLMEIPSRGHGLATSYASKRVAREFIYLMRHANGRDYTSILAG
jgi:hypothetical protein